MGRASSSTFLLAIGFGGWLLLGMFKTIGTDFGLLFEGEGWILDRSREFVEDDRLKEELSEVMDLKIPFIGFLESLL
jgi:hypothetical protein